MSPITDPSEEYFKDGLWGWVVNQWKKLIADAAGHLQVDVLTSGLPAGGATAANQATIITALQLIDDLHDALNSIATDELDIVFDGQNLDVEVTQTAPADLLTGIHGWDGSVWRKLQQLWGYSDRYSEVAFDYTALVNDNLSTTPVPAGEVHVVIAIEAFNNDNNFDRLQIMPRTAIEAGPHLLDLYTLTAGVAYTWSGSLPLKEDDFIRAYFDGNTAGDDLYLRVWGYEMHIAT